MLPNKEFIDTKIYKYNMSNSLQMMSIYPWLPMLVGMAIT